MGHTDSPPTGPDLAQGIALADVPATGLLAGHVDGEPVLLARLHDGLHAVGGKCTHYGAPLGEGLVVGEQVRCPWHHACFSLRTGRAECAPAFAPLPTYRVVVDGDRVAVRAHVEPVPQPAPRASSQRIVIVGGGAAGHAAALRLRELGHAGSITMLSADAAPPCDRPNLSKDYLAGTAPEDWIPLQPPEAYADQQVDLRVDTTVAAIDVDGRAVRLADGATVPFDALLLATGAEPRRLPVPGFDAPNVHVLRTLADARALIAACANAASVAIIGAGFIGLEAAGALRTRGLRVHVIAPEAVPLARLVGPDIGAFVADLHRANGVEFHLGRNVRGLEGRSIALDDGSVVHADVVLVGAGVTPRTALAEAAGLATRDGILVDARLRTSAPGIFAAGDVARYPFGADTLRVEHWVHAQRQGQVAAANLLGGEQAFADVPYFWTEHGGVSLRCTGSTLGWDEIRLAGSLADRDFIARYFHAGELIAALSVGRDRENLEVEAQLGRR
jgi:NADPH-dependent 2,4-dienoyl-CoA reductase/sulfur reductase-like enzyme/nitrite reductase/ring-hydroxylating ferredoxin subunit